MRSGGEVAPPRVVDEWSRPEKAAPRPQAGSPLPWRQVTAEGPPPLDESPGLYIHQSLVERITERALEGSRQRQEDLGLLIGDFARDEDGAIFSVAWGMPTGDVDASPVGVRFTHEGLTQVARDLEARQRDYVVVGWYHSHLDLGCFMSDRDLRTQRGGFPHPHQVALVVDPVRGEAAAFGNGQRGPGTLVCPFSSYIEWEG